MAHAETFYRERGSATKIQLSTASAPSSLRALLEAAGYRPAARTLVEVAASRDVAAPPTTPIDVELADTPSDDWFRLYWSVESERGRQTSDARTYRDIFLAPGLPSAFATAHDDGAVIGVGQLVVESGWAGVQCMATDRRQRRRGVARAVLGALGTEAVRRGVSRMYLAVLAENQPARRLYDDAGFAATHEYEYFTKD